MPIELSARKIRTIKILRQYFVNVVFHCIPCSDFERTITLTDIVLELHKDNHLDNNYAYFDLCCIFKVRIEHKFDLKSHTFSKIIQIFSSSKNRNANIDKQIL